MDTRLIFLFLPILITSGVFDVVTGEESVSVNVGYSVTLHTNTLIHKKDVIEWRCGGKVIASIKNGATSLNGTDERFRDRMKLNNQTGDLTITNITYQLSGLYTLKSITRRTKSSLSVSVFGDPDEVKSVSVMEGDSVTLHTHTDINKYVIGWKFQQEFCPLIEMNRTTEIISTHNDVLDSRFRDRLKPNNETGDLTIKNIKINNSGLYVVNIDSSSRTHTIQKIYNVTASDGEKILSVLTGASVPLNLDTELHNDDKILWSFTSDGSLIAKLYNPEHIRTLYEVDGRFSNKLNLNDRTGSLTIINIKTEHSGVYEVKVIGSRRSLDRKFTVNVSALSSGAIAGICFAVLLVIAAVVVGMLFYRHRYPKERIKEVMEGDSVFLNSDVDLKKDDMEMEWEFRNTRIAEMKKSTNKIWDCLDGRFKDRLTMDQLGSLTIIDATTKDDGHYQLKIKMDNKTSYKIFKLTVINSNCVEEGLQINERLII